MKKKLTRTDKVFIILGVIFSILLICSGVFYNEIYTKINTGADILLWGSLIAVIVLFIAAFFRILYRSGSEETFNGYIIVPAAVILICGLLAYMLMQPVSEYRLDRKYENSRFEMQECIDGYLTNQDKTLRTIPLPEEYADLSVTGEVIQYEDGAFYFFPVFMHESRIEGFAYMISDAPYQSVMEDYSNFYIELLGNNFSYLTLYY